MKHPMRSEHNFSPERLWTAGLQSIASTGSLIAKEVFENLRDVRSTPMKQNVATVITLVKGVGGGGGG